MGARAPRLSFQFAGAAWAAGVIAVVECADAQQLRGTRVLHPVADNTIFEDPSGALSNGRGCFILAGKTGVNPPLTRPLIRRGLVRFDLSDLLGGARIVGCTLVVTVERMSQGVAPHSLALHRVTRSWGEAASTTGCEAASGLGAPAEAGDATWLHAFYPDLPWDRAGGDYEGSASWTGPVLAVGVQRLSSEAIRTDVASWVETPSGNHGWLIRGNESSNRTAVKLWSREGGPELGPKLVVVYEIDGRPEEPRACCLADGRCALLTQSACVDSQGTPSQSPECSPNPCVQPCCLGLRCEDLDRNECARRGGMARPGPSCAATACVLEAFVDSLPIPPVANPVAGVAGGEATYEMPMRRFKHLFHRDLDSTVVWGYAGRHPGPTIEARCGAQVTVHWINDLRDSAGSYLSEHTLPVDPCLRGARSDEPPRTVVHLHGAHVAPESDGYPEYTFGPGERAEYVYPNRQLPATLWYHDHAMGTTRLNVMMGLAGFYLLRDPAESDLGLPPRDYEVPLVVQDRSFTTRGAIAYPRTWEPQFLGDYTAVNGRVWPYLRVKRGLYRLRLLNASNFRDYVFELSNGAPFRVIGTEGGFLTEPVSVGRLSLMPAERADVIVDFSGEPPGSEILLTNAASRQVMPHVMKFIVTEEAGFAGVAGAGPPPVVRLREEDAETTREFRITLSDRLDDCGRRKFLFNDREWDEIDDFPRLGSTEIWSFINLTTSPHPIHIHLVMFQILDRQPFVLSPTDSIVPSGPPVPPDPAERGWKDTAPVGPNEIMRLIMRFTGFTGHYPFHCHMLEHEDNELMRQFVVTDTVAPNRPPEVSQARASTAILWPPDQGLTLIRIMGVTDPDGDPVTITIDAISQDEPLVGPRPRDEDGAVPPSRRVHSEEIGSGGGGGGGGAKMCPDAAIHADGTASLRRERNPDGDGRVYFISFTARDGRGNSNRGEVQVCVPTSMRSGPCRPGPRRVGSLGPCVATRTEEDGAPPLSLSATRAADGAMIFEFEPSEAGEFHLDVHDVAGRRVAILESGHVGEGRRRVRWDLSGVPAGIYFASLRCARGQAKRTVLVLR